MQAGADPLRGIGGQVRAAAGAQARDQSVLPRTLRALHEAAPAQPQVAVGRGGDVHAHGYDVARPLTTLARGIVDERILGAGAVRLDARHPDALQQRVAADEGAVRRAVVASLDKSLFNEARLL